jgi:hypothetical protein
MGGEDGPATGEIGDVEVEVDGIRGNGRMPDDEADLPLPLPLPLISGCLPSFLGLRLGPSG